MTFCRHCEDSFDWTPGERCRLCPRVGEAGGFPERWLVAGDDHADVTERLRRWATRAKQREAS